MSSQVPVDESGNLFRKQMEKKRVNGKKDFVYMVMLLFHPKGGGGERPMTRSFSYARALGLFPGVSLQESLKLYMEKRKKIGCRGILSLTEGSASGIKILC